MSLSGLGTKRQRARLPIVALFSGGCMLAALILFALELYRFAQGRDLLQTDITVAGVPVAGLNLSQARTVWESVYSQPIELDYQGRHVRLNPADIGFLIKSDLIVTDIRAKIASNSNYWSDFWNYLWRRPTNPISVDLIADYSEAKLKAFLQDLADRYDRGASIADFNTATMTFGAGLDGLRLDTKKSAEEIRLALFRPTNRKVRLPVTGESARSADMNTLKKAILDYLKAKPFSPDGPDTLASIVVIDLQNGQEMTINPDVAYSSMSTIKIPIMVNIFKMPFAFDNDTKWLMGASILCSSNSASNFLIQIPGLGTDAVSKLRDGLAQVTNTVQALGAKNTFISAPLDVGDKNYQFSIPAPKTSPNPALNAKPDLFSQTTAEDMAALLQEIYDCSEYSSGLIAVFPDRYNPTKCKQMLELLSGNVIGRLIELGIPPGTRISHKNGWGGAAGGKSGANVSDAAVIYTPGGNYILVTYMWEAKANQDGIGSLTPWEAIEGISRITYNFFNPDNPMLVSRVPENPLGAIDCVMPSPAHVERLDLNNIKNGRFDAEGNILPDACYGYPACDKKK